MSTFPIRDDEYSVEEISYEDMMSLLSTRKKTGSKPRSEAEQPVHVAKTELKPNPNPVNPDPVNQSRPLKRNELSERLSEYANQPLPSWLLNH